MERKSTRRVRRPAKARDPFLLRTKSARFLPYLALTLTVLFVLKVRIGLLDIPLERDEGGFAYVAKAVREGAPLYTELRDTKLPGLYLAYGLIITIFGADPAGVHTGLLLFNMATIILLFFMVKRLFDPITATVCAASYAILSITPGILGFAAHATHLVVLPGLGGVYLLWIGIEKRKLLILFLAGLLFGVAFTIKQPSVHFMLFGGVYLLIRELSRRPRNWKFLVTGGLGLMAGSVILYILTVVLMLSRGIFSEFWFWTFEWPSQFAAMPNVSERVGLFKFMFGRLVEGQTYLWILSGLGILLTIPSNVPLDRKLFAYLLLLIMFAAVGTGFHFYPHYFVLVLAPVSIFLGLFVRSTVNLLLDRFQSRWLIGLPILVFVAAWVQIITVERDYFFRPDFTRILRSSYGTNPFPESLEIGRFIKERRQAGDKMVIFGSEPQIYLYADCEAASGHVFIYPLVDGGSHNIRLQDEMIEEVTSDEPRFLLYVTSNASWLNVDPSNRLLTWMQSYVDDHYYPIAITDIFEDRTVYKWNEDVRNYQHQSTSAVIVFERR